MLALALKIQPTATSPATLREIADCFLDAGDFYLKASRSNAVPNAIHLARQHLATAVPIYQQLKDKEGQRLVAEMIAELPN
jgi:hypothetical protein